ncbi:MAG: hypothetical protein AAGA48_27095 [Myxococcota bacterium]
MPFAALRWLGPGGVVCGLAFVALALPTLGSAVDDAWISGRYAAHLVAGHGLVFNVDGPSVEGFSNPLWTMWLALGLVLTGEVHPFMTWTGLGFGLLLLPCATGLAATLAGRWHPATLLAPATLALSPHVVVACTNGLETAQWLCLLVASAWATFAAEGPWRVLTAVLCVALALCRPEGMAVGAWFVAFDALRHRRREVAVGFVGALVVLEAWRLAFYGAWVPHPVLAKTTDVSFVENLRYVGRDGVLWPWVGWSLLGAALVLPRRMEGLGLVLVAVGLVGVAFQVELWMPASRLLLPAGVFSACAMAGVAASPGRGAVPAGLSLVVGLGLLHLSPLPSTVREDDHKHSVDAPWASLQAAAFLAERLPPGSTVAIRDAGAFAYGIGPLHRVIETHPLGLTGPPEAWPDPELIVTTVRQPNTTWLLYPEDRVWLEGTSVPYVHLGKIKQHHRRYYDVWAHPDLGLPPLPPHLVVPDTRPVTPSGRVR